MKPLRHIWMAAGVVLVACAGPAQWEKSGGSPSALDEDRKQCDQQARVTAAAGMTPPPPSLPGSTGVPTRQEQFSMNEAQAFQRCMLGKGYSEKR